MATQSIPIHCSLSHVPDIEAISSPHPAIPNTVWHQHYVAASAILIEIVRLCLGSDLPDTAESILLLLVFGNIDGFNQFPSPIPISIILETIMGAARRSTDWGWYIIWSWTIAILHTWNIGFIQWIGDSPSFSAIPRLAQAIVQVRQSIDHLILISFHKRDVPVDQWETLTHCRITIASRQREWPTYREKISNPITISRHKEAPYEDTNATGYVCVYLEASLWPRENKFDWSQTLLISMG